MSFAGVLCVCLFLLCVFPFPGVLSQRKTAMSRHQQELKEHYEHLAKIAEFECDLPQPRLLSVHDLLSDFQTRGKAYFPEVTVLHRCDRHVGSCNDAMHQCGPTTAAPVSMPFKVTFLDAAEGHTKGQWRMEYHSLQNHTACGCLRVEEAATAPTKTAVHYHYVDPALMPPQRLPLEPTGEQPLGNASSYDVPLYQLNTTRGETDQRPSIYDMAKAAEEEIAPKPSDVAPEIDGQKPKPEEEEEVKPEDNKCPSCIEEPGYSNSESPTNNEVAVSSTSKAHQTDNVDEKSTTDAADELDVRFGAEHKPMSEALKDVDSPYDSYLKQSF